MNFVFWIILLTASYCCLQIMKKISPEEFGGYCAYVVLINLLALLLFLSRQGL